LLDANNPAGTPEMEDHGAVRGAHHAVGILFRLGGGYFSFPSGPGGFTEALPMDHAQLVLTFSFCPEEKGRVPVARFS
jgi:hypothetical protein